MGFHPKGGKEPLKSFKKESDMDKISFWKSHSGCKMKYWLLRGKGRGILKVKSYVCWLFY